MVLLLCFLLIELCIFGIEEMLSGHFFESCNKIGKGVFLCFYIVFFNASVVYFKTRAK